MRTHILLSHTLRDQITNQCESPYPNPPCTISSTHGSQARSYWGILGWYRLRAIAIAVSAVLIWSQPWNESGYYLPDMDTKGLYVFLYFEDDHIMANRHNGTDLESDKYSISSENGQWNGTRNIYPNAVAHVEITFEEKRLRLKDWITQDNTKTDPLTTFSGKTSNPFTHWYIKWLEWTAE